MDEGKLFAGLIKKYLLKEYVKITLPDQNHLRVVINFSKELTISLGHKTSWIDVKRRIDKVMSTESGECNICEDYESKSNNQMVQCHKCANHYCIYCYIDTLTRNKGVIICPFCRDQKGSTLSDKDLKMRTNNFCKLNNLYLR